MPYVQTEKIEGNVRLRRGREGVLTVEQDWHFRIRADSVDQDRLTILYSTPGVPKYGVFYGPYALQLDSADGDRMEEDATLWDCVYHLSNNVQEGSDRDQATGQQQQGAPTEWIPWVELGFEEYEEVFRESLAIETDERHPDIGGADADGYNARKWTNSAGQPYETGFVRRKRLITRKFTQFEPANTTVETIEGRNDTLNNATYLGKPKRTLRLQVDAAAIGLYYGVRCWRIDYTLKYKADDWRLKQLDTGWYYKDGNNLEPFKDVQGNPIVGALDGAGGSAEDQTDPAVRYHKEFPSINFSSFLRLHL